MERSKYFPLYVGISALFVAINAAYFSIFGLSKLFAGATLSVIVMASSLEFGKLVGASFLYRYWHKIHGLMKTYMLIAVVLLIGITSMGIFGFLSNAYQEAKVGFEKESTLLLNYEDRLAQLQEDKIFLKEELEDQVNDLPENYRTAKRKLREDYNPRIRKVNDDILDIKGKISDLKVTLVQTGVDVGPAIYISKVFGTNIDTVVNFFIFAFVFVFDPLAVVLVIAFNVALGDKDWEMYNKKKKKKKLSPPTQEPEEEQKEESAVPPGGIVHDIRTNISKLGEKIHMGRKKA